MTSRTYTAFLVSPDRALLRRAARFLEVCGYEIGTAADYGQASRLLAARSPDFLILDPGDTPQAALQLARQVRAQKVGGPTYTLLLTDQPSVRELLESLQAGCDDFLARPVALGEWLARMKGGARALEFERRLLEQRGRDSLTGFASRAAFIRQVQASVERTRGETSAALVLFQLDGGAALLATAAATVEAALVHAAERLKERASPPSIFARWDETTLAVFLPDEQETGAAKWGESLRQQFALPGETGKFPGATWSAGVVGGTPGENVESWLQIGAQALRLAAKSGGDCLATGRQCLEESEAWSADAAGGKLFATTNARDVMSLCPLVFSRDETVDAAAALMRQTAVSVAPVVDEAGHFIGVITPGELEARASRIASGRQSGSVRLLRHCVSTDSDIPQFDEHASLADLLDYFGADPQPFAVVLSHCRPIGMIYCESLACLSEPINSEALQATGDPLGGSDYLLVGELCEA